MRQALADRTVGLIVRRWNFVGRWCVNGMAGHGQRHGGCQVRGAMDVRLRDDRLRCKCKQGQERDQEPGRAVACRKSPASGHDLWVDSHGIRSNQRMGESMPNPLCGATHRVLTFWGSA